MILPLKNYPWPAAQGRHDRKDFWTRISTEEKSVRISVYLCPIKLGCARRGLQLESRVTIYFVKIPSPDQTWFIHAPDYSLA